MGKNKTSSTQTTTNTLPAGQQRNVDTLLNAALGYFNSGGREFFPGDIVADFDPYQTEGQEGIVDYARGIGGDLVGNTIGSLNTLLDPSMLNPMAAPGFEGVIDTILRKSSENYNEQILPNIRSGAIAAGQFGGAPQGVATGVAEGKRQANELDAISGLTLGQYGLGLQAMQNAINSAPGIFQLGSLPAQLIQGVGDIRQNQAQNEIQGQVARHEFEQNEPAFQLQLLRDLTGRYGDYGGTSTTKAEQTTKSSPVNQVLGGALTAASLWNPAMSLFKGLAPTTGGVGSVFKNLAQNSGIGSAFGPMPTGQSLWPISIGGN